MPWFRTSNVAMYEGANWDGYLHTVPNCSPAQAQRIALLDPNTSFFFYCRQGISLQNPTRNFYAGDAIFFSGQPWFGSASECDTYQKNGMSVAYVCGPNNSPQQVAQAGCYLTAQGLPAIDVVSIFAANINTTPSGSAERLAPSIQVPQGYALACGNLDIIKLLQSGVIQSLQNVGITVLLTFLNNWDDSGWSEFTIPADAQCFANQLQYVVTNYGLDGIDIDDEYPSNFTSNNPSLAMVTTLMKQAMPDKIISKALFQDYQSFGVSFNGTTLEQNLTYGWEMTYGGSSPSGRLEPYLRLGMSPNQLSLGFNGSEVPPNSIPWLKTNGYAGIMVYDFDSSAGTPLLGQLVNEWCGPGNWNLKPNCPSENFLSFKSSSKKSSEKITVIDNKPSKPVLNPLPFQPKRSFSSSYQQHGLMRPILEKEAHRRHSTVYSPRFISGQKGIGYKSLSGKLVQKAAPLLRHFVR